MHIKSVDLRNFRNYEQLSIDFSPNVNLILGENGQGKTNLIESIYFSSIGKSFRTSKDNQLIGFNSEYSTIKTIAEKSNIETDIFITLKKNGKKEIKKDGVYLRKMSEMMDNIITVSFSPEDLKIVKDEPEKRRKFIDRELCLISTKYYHRVSSYKKTLLQRNFYLKSDKIDDSVLEIWDRQLVDCGIDVVIIRNNFIKKLEQYSSDIHNEITGGREELKLEYESQIIEKCRKEYGENFSFYSDKTEEYKELFYEMLKENRNRDKQNKNTSVGPHKDDLSFIVNEIDMRNYGSQGQQRTCALSAKMAELKLIKEVKKEDAILLLDDVMSELDHNRQEFLINALKGNQLFITTTELKDEITTKFSNLKKYWVKNGKISLSDVF